MVSTPCHLCLSHTLRNAFLTRSFSRKSAESGVHLSSLWLTVTELKLEIKTEPSTSKQYRTSKTTRFHQKSLADSSQSRQFVPNQKGLSKTKGPLIFIFFSERNSREKKRNKLARDNGMISHAIGSERIQTRTKSTNIRTDWDTVDERRRNYNHNWCEPQRKKL